MADLDLPGGGHTTVVGVDGGGAGDPVARTPGLRRQLAAKLTGARVEHRFVTRPTDEDGPAFDHFVWARHPGSFAGDIATWLRGAVTPG